MNKSIGAMVDNMADYEHENRKTRDNLADRHGRLAEELGYHPHEAHERAEALRAKLHARSKKFKEIVANHGMKEHEQSYWDKK